MGILQPLLLQEKKIFLKKKSKKKCTLYQYSHLHSIPYSFFTQTGSYVSSLTVKNILKTTVRYIPVILLVQAEGLWQKNFRCLSCLLMSACVFVYTDE